MSFYRINYCEGPEYLVNWVKSHCSYCNLTWQGDTGEDKVEQCPLYGDRLVLEFSYHPELLR